MKKSLFNEYCTSKYKSELMRLRELEQEMTERLMSETIEFTKPNHDELNCQKARTEKRNAINNLQKDIYDVRLKIARVIQNQSKEKETLIMENTVKHVKGFYLLKDDKGAYEIWKENAYIEMGEHTDKMIAEVHDKMYALKILHILSN